MGQKNSIGSSIHPSINPSIHPAKMCCGADGDETVDGGMKEVRRSITV